MTFGIVIGVIIVLHIPALVVFGKIGVHIEERAADCLVSHFHIPTFRQQEFIDHRKKFIVKLHERAFVRDGESRSFIPI